MSDKWEESARKRAEEFIVSQEYPAPFGTALFIKIHPDVEPLFLGVEPPERRGQLRERAVAHLAHLIGQLEDERREVAAGEDW
jgi:hypothetical protein